MKGGRKRLTRAQKVLLAKVRAGKTVRDSQDLNELLRRGLLSYKDVKCITSN